MANLKRACAPGTRASAGVEMGVSDEHPGAVHRVLRPQAPLLADALVRLHAVPAAERAVPGLHQRKTRERGQPPGGVQRQHVVAPAPGEKMIRLMMPERRRKARAE